MVSGKKRLCGLRELMAKWGVEAYLLPSTDEHHSEYVPERARRLAWLSGFTGSSGTVVVTGQEAFLWTDGRYHLQASQELDPQAFTLMRAGLEGVPEPEDLLCSRLAPGQKVGLDPRLVSIEGFRKMEERLGPFGIKILPLEENLVDLLWEDRPPPPRGPIWPLPERFAGMGLGEKLELVRKELNRWGAQALVLGALDEIAWLLNLRGSDVPYNPVFQGYLLLTLEEALLFVETTRLSQGARDALLQRVSVQPYDRMAGVLRDLARAGMRFMVDPSSTSHWVRELMGRELNHLERPSPVALLKSVKNPVEREGMASCHVRDGAAMVRFLKWLEEQVPRGGLTELEAARYLDHLRASMEHHVGPSFETIVAYGPNGAIVHYRPSPRSTLELAPEGLVLVDSGAHYLDGTTDVTRTVALGQPTSMQKERFTRVLKGHIALASIRFPRGITGKQLDALARTHLWEVGLDYRHGTGHGIGCYLNVHEGPQSISPRDPGVPLQEGMFLTNEPGYYEDGEYGIRIENVMMVEQARDSDSGYGPFLQFRTITMVPLDRRLICMDLLTARELAWVNQYHQKVRETLSPILEPQEASWLEEATRPL
jgi:Xaa-Pro aminopeptidase